MAVQFYNAGYPGDNTEKILARLEKDVFSCKPSLVVLQCGTNDAINPRALVPEEVFRKNIALLAEKILGKGSALILIAPPPCIEDEVRKRYDFPLLPGEEKGKLDSALRCYGEIMGEFAREKDLPFMDLFRIFEGRGKLGNSPESLIRNFANSNTSDGAHPTIEGHKLIARFLSNLIISRGMDFSTTVFLGDSITSGYPFPGMGTMQGSNFPSFTAQTLNGE